VRELLALRRRHIVPRLAGMTGGGRFVIVNSALHVEWTLGDGARLHLAVNFTHQDAVLPQAPAGQSLYSSAAFAEDGALRLAPAGVAVTLEAT